MDKVALSFAASALSPIFKSLGDKAASYFGGDITEEELHNLNCFVIPKIQTAIKLADETDMDELKPWLRALKAAAYEAEDVLDMYEYKRLQAQVSPLPTSIKKLSRKAKKLFAPITLKTKLKTSMEKLQKYADQAEKLIPVPGSINQAALKRETVIQQPLPSVSTPSSKVFGREQERNFLVDVLISVPNDEPSRNPVGHVPVVAIHGIGGAGKTTLAQDVYNDPRIAQHFDNNRMWVHVSNNFDGCKVTREIIEAVTGDGTHNNINSLDVLQRELKKVLKSKRFLLVLDDVWCDDKIKWDQVLVPLNEVGDTGSRILITTRTEDVASKLGVDEPITLKELQSEDYWSIFKHYAFGDADKNIDDPALLEVAEQIVKKLSKSPLAARMVGSLLNREMDVDRWKMILKHQDMMKDAFDALLLSFQYLPPHLQQCFSFCSLYPKGRQFWDERLDDLIKLWIAQGFVEAHNMNNMTVEEKGQQYFKDLVAHSFFQKNLRGNYVIHDLLHDLAEKVSKDHCFRIEGDERITIPSTILHLSIASHNVSLHIPDILKLVNLRTFINLHTFVNFDRSDVDFNDIAIVKNNMFKKLTKLRVFDAGLFSMGAYPKLELHSSIGQLKHLRLLKLRVNHKPIKMPESLCTLYHLQYLIFDGYGYNTFTMYTLPYTIPQGLHNLINLRCFDDRINLRCIIHDGEWRQKDVFSRIPLFGQLTSLQQLKVYHATRNKNCEIGQLKYLQELRGSLRICNLENVRDKAEAMEASLKDKKHLDELGLQWKHGVEEDDRMDEEVLEGLEPPPNLQILRINGYLGVKFPRWMLNNSNFLSNLQSLDLSCCSKLCIVPPLGQLRLLTKLYISSMPLVEEIGPDFYGRSDNGELAIRFPRLEVLEFKKMESWVHWYGGTDGVELFPRLQELSIEDCPNLLQVPPCVPHTLKKLTITWCKKLSGMFPVPSSLEELKIFGNFPGIESLMPCDDQQEEEEEEEEQYFQQQKNKSPNHQLFPCLCRLSVSACSYLVQIPRLPLTLQKLKISHCKNLQGVCGPIPQSLRSLKVQKCPKLMQLSPFLYRVEEMKMEGCPAGVEDMQQQQQRQVEKQIFKCPDGFTSISKLILVGLTSLVLGPNLPALEHLRIEECENLESMGSSLASILSLKYLKICNCPRLMMQQQQPDGEDDDNTLTSLLLLPPSLDQLVIQNCGDLQSLPELSNLRSLMCLVVDGCPQLTSLGNSQCLFELCVKRCPRLQIEGGGGGDGTAACCHFPYLRNVTTDDLYMLAALLRRNQSLTNSLESLRIIDCGQDIGFTPEQEKLFHQLTSLKELSFECCQNLPSLPVTLKKLSSLERLELRRCPKIESLPNLPTSLVHLWVSECHEQMLVKYGKDGPLRKKISHVPIIDME